MHFHRPTNYTEANNNQRQRPLLTQLKSLNPFCTHPQHTVSREAIFRKVNGGESKFAECQAKAKQAILECLRYLTPANGKQRDWQVRPDPMHCGRFNAASMQRLSRMLLRLVKVRVPQVHYIRISPSRAISEDQCGREAINLFQLSWATTEEDGASWWLGLATYERTPYCSFWDNVWESQRSIDQATNLTCCPHSVCKARKGSETWDPPRSVTLIKWMHLQRLRPCRIMSLNLVIDVDRGPSAE